EPDDAIVRLCCGQRRIRGIGISGLIVAVDALAYVQVGLALPYQLSRFDGDPDANAAPRAMVVPFDRSVLSNLADETVQIALMSRASAATAMTRDPLQRT